MVRAKITKEDVFRAADALARRGARPSVRAVRNELGRGGTDTISRYLREWKVAGGGAPAEKERSAPAGAEAARPRARGRAAARAPRPAPPPRGLPGAFFGFARSAAEFVVTAAANVAVEGAAKVGEAARRAAGRGGGASAVRRSTGCRFCEAERRRAEAFARERDVLREEIAAVRTRLANAMASSDSRQMIVQRLSAELEKAKEEFAAYKEEAERKIRELTEALAGRGSAPKKQPPRGGRKKTSA
ncbi:hypothetical protein G3N55_01255 [Dissulfurirhabdus thermomarina]|uniref:KfrA N-terminal DNA-binding domain-containing protein n=1 Tax=Dissulfurirhabdus thermomarina TaxID=1765737 RepID=A0A6N9TM22_DISTH|nr:DNA-binding protein [Dissulfurirhabdus thermomarina]NDY41480.1 hypothetical protein [Dissulfurirhabdus thermomarina]NMX23893.1 hypothetical protein [Dissulfurirhabdus thermomarina]